MKKCVRCGKEIPDIAGFCKHCGAKQVLEESQQDSGSASSKAALYNKLNWEITSVIANLNSVSFDIFTEINDLTQKIQGYAIDSLSDYFANGVDNDYQNAKCPLYPEVLSVLSNARSKFAECHSQAITVAKEMKAALLKDTGEDIDISSLDLDENLFTVPSGLNTEDLCDTIMDLNMKISDYSSSIAELLDEMGDKTCEIIDRLSEQK